MANQEKSAAELYREERKERLAKAAKKNQKKSHNIVLSKKAKSTIAVVLVVALIAGIAAFSISNSGMLERSKVAFTVGDEEVSMAEYGYYYNSIFSNYFQYSYQYDMYYGQGMGALYTGYDYSVTPDQQAYPDEIEGVEEPKWVDFFEMSAKNSIKYVKSSIAYAKENNIALDEKDIASVDKTIASVEETAKKQNYSVPAYLRAFYGKAMTMSLLRTICEEQTLAAKVQELKTEEYAESYSDKVVEKAYKDGLTTYGVVSLRNYVIKADTVEVKAEEEGAEPTKEVTEKTMKEAKTKAESFKSKVTDEKSFKATAAEFEKLAENKDYKTFETDDSKTLLADTTYDNLSYDAFDEKFLAWAFDEDTAKNDTYIVENEDTGYTVYMMTSPVHKAADIKTYDVRHILLQFPEAKQEDAEKEEDAKEEKEVEVELLDASAYDVTVDIDVDLEKTKDKALYKNAQDILKTYLDGDKTEDAFAELAAKHSADSNAADGGIYEDVPLGKMVPEFEGWAIAEGRKVGDVGIVETTYGYHIMYYIDSEITTWEDTIRNDLAAVDYQDFAEELEAGENVAIANIDEDALASVEEFILTLARNQIRNITQSASAGTY